MTYARSENIALERRLKIHQSRHYYDDVLTVFSDDFETIKNNLSSLPQPQNTVPSYSFNREENLSVEEAANQDSPGLDKIVDNFVRRFSKLEGLDDVLRKMFLTNRTVFTRFKDAGPEDKMRKYEKHKYAILHTIETTYLLPEESPPRHVILSLSHDTIEDSHRYKILKRWFDGESLKKEDLEIIGLTDNQSNGDETLNKRIFNQKTQEFIEEYLDLIGLDRSSKMYKNLYHGINLATKRPWEGYDEYVSRMTGNNDKMGESFEKLTESRLIRFFYHNFPLYKKHIDNITDYEYSSHVDSRQDFHIIYPVVLMKLNDRSNNSHFSVPEQEENEGNKSYISRIGKKRILDGYKNFLTMEKIKEFELQNSARMRLHEDNFQRAFYGLADINNRNMDEFLNLMRQTYVGTDEEWNRKPIDEWFQDIETRMYDYFDEEEGFDKITEAKESYRVIFHFDGSTKILSDFVDNEIMDERDDSESNYLFGSERADKGAHILRLYKYGGIIKVLSCLFMSHVPFAENGRLVEGLGDYNPGYENYNLSRDPKISFLRNGQTEERQKRLQYGLNKIGMMRWS